MLKTVSLGFAALATAATAMVPAAVEAQSRHHGRSSGYERGYDRDGYRTYQRDDYRHYRARQRCDDGDGGTLIGAIAGGLLGHSVAGRGDRALGTVLGAGAGALAGRAIDRSDRPGYCRR